MKKLISVVLAVVMLLSAFSMTACDNSKEVSTTPVVSTENFTITKGMFAYYFNVMYSGYADSLESLGIDKNVSLKDQACIYVLKGEKTWFTYFVEMTKDRVASKLALCQEAYNAGVTLSEDEISNIDSYMADISEAAKNYGKGIDEYVSLVINNPFSGVELRKCLEMDALAAKYADELYSTAVFTDEEIEAYYQANKSAYDTMDMYTFTVIADKTDPTDVEQVREKIKTFTESATVETFPDLIREYIEQDYADNDLEITDADRESIERYVSKSLNRGVGKFDFKIADTASWAEKAKVGDTYLEENDGTFTVYLVVREFSRDSTFTRNVRHVLFSNDTYRDDAIPTKIYNEWGDGGFTEDGIIKLAKEYSQDEGSAEDGGLYTEVVYGEMITEFNAWLFDESRVPGDHGIVETEYGWHLMYYVGENNVPLWKVSVIADLTDKRYDDVIDAYYYDFVYDEAVIADLEA
ncbi:MAG: peptidylprolyl isomerase [Clostridia bacterium]|nr:peptidylprolyl isomerase [Clostridia bacterium]